MPVNITEKISNLSVAVVIVLYQPHKEDIANVIRLSNVFVGVIIDNSQEKTFKDEQLGKMQYIPLKENVGIAEAQNIGIRYIFNHTDATHIVFLDQDSTVPTTYADDIAKSFNRIKLNVPNLAFLGPKTENKITGKEYKSIIHQEKSLTPEFILKREVISSGGCTTKEVLKTVGLNDSKLFIDYVDFDWCWRAKSKGLVCGITPNITIKHMVGQKTIYIGGYTIIVSSPNRYYYQFRNYLWLLRKKYVPLQWKINKGIKHIAQFIYFPIFIKSGFSCWKYMVKGFFAGITLKNEKGNK